ncbi:hypothetical protein [Flagellimonas sp.]|uniref:hypothetical protein n=1 Tax=Flagellimonas sp. TaxID=2058762 RepID=UPI003B50BF36
MTANNTHNLLKEFQNVLKYYLDKTERVMNLYQDTAETQYFLFALKGTMSFIQNKEKVDVLSLKKSIDGLIAGQKGRNGNDRLSDLRNELEEELAILKLRYDLI